jgi:hypothetical protein
LIIGFIELFNALLLLGGGFQWQVFSFLWITELFLASATSF